MNSKELVRSTLQGLPVPRVPVGPLAVHFCARTTGISLRQYTTSARLLAESVLRYYERFRPDAVWISADTWVSAQAMGAPVGAVDDYQPFGGVGPALVRSASDILRIPKPDVTAQGRYPLMLEALSRVSDELGREVFIVACFDQYPFSLTAALMGIDNTMLNLVDDPPMVEALMLRCAEYAIAYGKALAAAGADLLSGGDSPASLISPRLYSRFVLPLEKYVITELKSTTRKPVSLHICGRRLPILEAMSQSGADVIEIECDIAEACRQVGPTTAIWGNIDPVRVLREGTPQTVRDEVSAVLSAVRNAGRSAFVLSSGCTLALDTPFENLDALIQGVTMPAWSNR